VNRRIASRRGWSGCLIPRHLPFSKSQRGIEYSFFSTAPIDHAKLFDKFLEDGAKLEELDFA
jgi:hypothetical protein